MGLLNSLLWGQQSAPQVGGWPGTPPFVPPQVQQQPLPPLNTEPLPQTPPYIPPQINQQRGGLMGGIGRLLGGGQQQPPQTPGMPTPPTPPTMRTNPLTFALGGQNALNSIFNNQAQAQQMQRQQRLDQRDDTVFGRQQTQWSQEDQQRRDWEEAVRGEPDPQRRAALRAMGPQGYGDWMAGEQQRAFAAQQQTNQQEFQSREGQLDREAQARAAAIRAANENPLGRMFQSMDAQQLGGMNQRASVLQAQTLPALRQVRENILQAGQSATGQPVDYNSRIVINRVFNGQGGDRQALETWRARILRPALEMLPPGPATDRDVALVMENFANPNMQLGSALSLIDERIAAAEREVIQASAANEFFGGANGLTGTRNAQGQDWPTFLAERMRTAPGVATTPQNSIPVGGYATPPAAAIAELRRDTSAAARAEFDQTFGPGAAARALGNRSNPSQESRRLNNGNLR